MADQADVLNRLEERKSVPADLRTRLKALVEEWREARFLTYSDWAADQLAALLAESEPEPYPACSCHAGSVCGEACSRGKHHDGCSWEGWRSMPTNEAKAKLPLGHEFVAAVDSLGRASKSSADFCGECGQPREAH